MSKYKERGAYHYRDYSDVTSPYHKHVNDVLHHVNRLFPKPAKILDIGCGEGFILSMLRGYLHDLKGCDVDKEAVSIAKDKGNFEVHLGDPRQLIWKHNFDAVLLLDVLEHVEGWKAMLMEVIKLAPMVFVAVPDRHDPHAVSGFDPDKFADFFLWNFFMDNRWTCLHTDVRHARHFMIFKQDGQA